ncbi:hypothetical protein [Saccharicrinis sp. GN24d3]|uniref:hypothetical protein n=1 Tax=Saccharicrinis sp. GN24d3 TaxID=3458416 RepID=UPI004035D46B
MRVCLTILILFISLCAQSQKRVLVFYNQDKAEAIQVTKGGLVVLMYQGYLKQMELESNYVLDINDSTVTIGKPRLFSEPVNKKKIRIEDIRGFRKVSAGSMLLKTALTVGATLGTYYTIRNNGDNLTSTQQLLYSTGAGLVTNLSLKLIFPDNKIKHQMKHGWKVMLR